MNFKTLSRIIYIFRSQSVDGLRENEDYELPGKIVIIGANAAGVHAASAARKTDPKSEIILITDEKHLAYSRCGLPYVLAGEIPTFEDLIVFPPSYYRMMKLDVRTETVAKSINSEEKIVETESKSGETEAVNYDTLVLTSGATPFILPIEGKEKRGVVAVRTLEDGRIIEKMMKETKSAVVIGAGFVGLETAHAFMERNIETTVIEVAPYIVPGLFDEDIADYIQKKIEEHGVKMLMGTRASEILGDDKVTGVKTADGEIEADIVVMATGVRPATTLATNIGIEVGVTRGIMVNPRMETNVQNVYAAGDCVESRSTITGLPCLIQLGTNAVRQGKVAGVNAAGGYATFPGVVCTAVSKMFDIEIGSVGLTEFQAKRIGFKTISGSITGKTRAAYFPGAKEIRIKIIAEPYMGRIMGAQIVGGEAVTQRINMISLGIQKEITVWELAQADTGYAPPLAETLEPVALAAEIASMKIRR